jgi:Zn-dependent peptidase ImmA (M78 family)/predicted secreted protein
MSGWRSRKDARAAGAMAAMRLWTKREMDPDRPVDIFSIIEEEQIWLMFQPLHNLFGFYARELVDEEEVAGIVVHSGHPLSVQRFTAAHEYGHHVLHHRASVDSEAEVYGRGNLPTQELAAQAFAADFLMPVPMVIRALRRLDLAEKPDGLDPVQAYQLSLELGASYTATITQLANLNRISRDHAGTLGRHQPVELKTELGGGRRPASARSDVWALDEHSRSRLLALRAGDELHVRLPEIPSGGYRWQVTLSTDAPELELVVDELEALGLEGSQRFGNVRRRHVWWRALGAGRGTASFSLRRVWEGESGQAVDAFTVGLTVVGPRTGELDHGSSWRQREAFAA